MCSVVGAVWPGALRVVGHGPDTTAVPHRGAAGDRGRDQRIRTRTSVRRRRAIRHCRYRAVAPPVSDPVTWIVWGADEDPITPGPPE
ncbi:hypothetical protein GS482_23500 [Rhodococcus hoagii]|nr:hypothetical protein [Prescottella equi]